MQSNKIFALRFMGFAIQSNICLQIVNSLQFFQNLKVLNLNLKLLIEERVQISCKSFKYLKQLFHLTHLHLESLGVYHIFFEDIDKHLPQQSIEKFKVIHF
jgi:hypothetical protein